MAFKHNAADMASRYKKHQTIAKSRLTGGITGIRPQDSATKGHGHPSLPKQMAPGINKTQTVQKDINGGTKSAHVPSQKLGFNAKTLQGDLNGAKAGVHKPGAK